MVPRDDSTVCGGPAQRGVENGTAQPIGTGFEKSDQVWSDKMWGRHFTWERWKIQSKRGQPEGYVCPLVQQDIDEKERKKDADYRSKRMDSKTETIQSMWHGDLKHAIKNEQSWAKQPEKYKDILAR